MADAGEIKAKVTIEYDGSGIQKAKEDLASLAEVGGGVQTGAENASAGLAGLDEQAAKNAVSAKSLNSALVELPKAFETGEASIASFNETLAVQPDVIQGTTQALKDMQEPLKSYNESLQAVSESFNPQAFGLNDFAENMSVFQDALVNPEPFAVIGQHLRETGQTWQDFTSSIGEDNVAMAHEMAANAGITGDHLDMLGAQAQTVGTAFQNSAGSTEEFTKQFAGLNESVANTSKEINALGGVGAALSGPEEAAASVGGLGEALSSTMSGMSEFFGGMAMPAMMAMQMVIPMVTQAAQGIYDMAAIAEGPAAHSMGTFTGQVDALGQTTQHVAAQFSESFGQQIIPSLNAMNYQMAQSVGTGQDLGGNLGAISSFLVNWGNTIEGPALMMNPATFGLGLDMTKAGVAGMINQGASAMGLGEPFQGPGASSQTTYDVVSVVHQQTMQTQQQVQTLLEDASNPAFLDQQNQLSAAQQVYQRAQQSYDIRHPVNQQQMLMGFQEQQYDQQQGQNYQDQMSQPPEKYSIAQAIDDWWKGLWKPGDSTGITSSGGGCFIAGTRVLMADGSEKAIETLQVGERVFAHDGTKQVATTILALITPPQKRVYKLTFSDGNTLTLTNSHPVSTTEGWRSLSPEATKEENPGLSVTTLAVGDSVCTTYGACTLTSILPLQGTRQIYNITVDAPHTFYAGGILVHNKVLSSHATEEIGSQTADQIGSITLPHIDLSGMTAGLTSAFSGLSLPHIDLSGLTAGLSSMFSGISLPAIPNIGSQISSELGSVFSGISMPSIPDLGGMINGAMSSMFGGISVPSIPDLGGMLNGAMSGMFGSIAVPSAPDVGAMIDGAMSGMFGGVQVPSAPDVGAMIDGAMTGMFSGITIPSPPDLGSQISASMIGMFSGISIPSVPRFASGVSNFSGGAAVVGEAGMEAVEYGGRYALFDQGAAFVNLPAGSSVYPLQDMSSYSSPHTLANGTGGGGFSPISLGGGGNMPQSINVSVHLDSQTILSAIGMPLAQTIRVAGGMRGF